MTEVKNNTPLTEDIIESFANEVEDEISLEIPPERRRVKTTS